MKPLSMVCPYCKAPALLKDASVIYNRPGYGQVYVCSNAPGCDSYVGVHDGTTKPKGSLANAELRKLRMEVHAVFDPLWRGFNAKAERQEVYRAAAQVLKLREFHIGEMRETQARAFLDNRTQLMLDVRQAIEYNRLSVLAGSDVTALTYVLRYLYIDSQSRETAVLSYNRYRGYIGTFKAAILAGLVKRIQKQETRKVFFVLTPAGKSAIAASV